MFLGITLLNLLVASGMLLFTSYLDVRKREVPDKVWIGFGAAGFVLQIYEVTNNITPLWTLLIAVALASVIGMGIFFVGLYGGADGKALIVLALLVPSFSPQVGIYAIAPLITLTNGVLLSMLLPIALLILNMFRLLRRQKIFDGFAEPTYKKILACLLGYRSSGKPKDFQFPMEKREGQSRKFDFSLMRDDFESSPGTWVTPGIPLLVFFTAGFFVLLLYGDLVIALIAAIAHI
ncbi:MAG: A24 family peptidase [Nitrososphaerales archaeon]